MLYGIHRVEKIKVAGKEVEGKQAENNRTEQDKGRFYERSDIDWNKTPENISLIRCENWREKATEEIKNLHLKKKIRSDATLLIDGYYGASPEWARQQTKETLEKYFKDCLAFHEKCYGKVINAVIHYDEATPHLHIVSIPITPDGRLSAKSLLGGKKEMSQRQTDFYNDVSRHYGLARGEMREVPKEHLTTTAYKLKKMEEQYQETAKKYQALIAKNGILRTTLERTREMVEKSGRKVEEATHEIETKQTVLNTLEDSIERAKQERTEIERLTAEQLQKLKEKDEEQALLQSKIAQGLQEVKQKRQALDRQYKEKRAALLKERDEELEKILKEQEHLSQLQADIEQRQADTKEIFTATLNLKNHYSRQWEILDKVLQDYGYTAEIAETTLGPVAYVSEDELQAKLTGKELEQQLIRAVNTKKAHDKENTTIQNKNHGHSR